MRTPVFCAVVVVAISAVMPGAAQTNVGSAESKIVALEKAWNQAYKFRDKKALSEILAPSIILVDDDGRLQSRGVFLAGVDAASSSEEQQAEPESISVRIFGDNAIATGVFRKNGIKRGKLFVSRNRFVDTWINVNGSWVCVAATAIPILQ
jgi:ketosteroid isomerase-like protein